jgi:acyl-CoA thioesterase-1
MAHPDPKVALTSRRMAHRTRRGPLQLLAGFWRAIVPESWRDRSGSKAPMAATDPTRPTESARASASTAAADSTAPAGSTAAADAASPAGSTSLVGTTGSSDTDEVARPSRKHTAAPERGRSSSPRQDGAAGGLGHLGRRLIPREPHRREFAAVLVLVLIACTVSASLPGVWAAHPTPSDPGDQAAVNLDPVDPSASPSDSTDDFSPLPPDVPTYTPPVPSVGAPNGPTPVPTPTPTKAPKPTARKVYTFVALGDSLTSGYGDPGPSWPTRLDTQDPYLRLLHNAGVPGDLTSGMRSRLNSDVFAYKPDVLFVMGGTNDIGHYISAATTIANLRAIIVAAKAKGITVVMMTIPPDSYPAWAGQINSLNSQIVHLANSYVLAVVDVHAALSTSDGVYVAKYTVDGVHFSALGAQVVANTVQARVKRYGW